MASERDRALARDVVARARLQADPVYLIKQRRAPRQHQQKRSSMEPRPSMAVTPRELDVLRCYSRGLTTAMVAETLGISVETVKHHTRSVRTEFAAKNTTAACCEAIRRGLIP